MIALGLIETQGLIPAIEAADAMLKAANVYLLERTCIGSGLVTITVASEDVGSVSAAVEAGAAAIARISGAILVSKHVIPRPDLELHTILKLTPSPSSTPQDKTEKAKVSEPEESKLQEAKINESTVLAQGTVSSTPTEIFASEISTNPVELAHTTKTVTPKQNIDKKIAKPAVTPAITKIVTPSKATTEATAKATTETTTETTAKATPKATAGTIATTAAENAKSKKQATPIRYTMAKLRTMKLDKLQEIANNIDNFPLSSDIIATANRDRLITEFMKIFK